jgi:hypothetical protein
VADQAFRRRWVYRVRPRRRAHRVKALWACKAAERHSGCSSGAKITPLFVGVRVSSRALQKILLKNLFLGDMKTIESVFLTHPTFYLIVDLKLFQIGSGQHEPKKLPHLVAFGRLLLHVQHPWHGMRHRRLFISLLNGDSNTKLEQFVAWNLSRAVSQLKQSEQIVSHPYKFLMRWRGKQAQWIRDFEDFSLESTF